MNDFLNAAKTETSEPVECLGQTFPNDDARRAHFLKLLAEKPKDLQTIIKVAGKIPEVALHEDEKLLLWYDQALTLSETGG